MHEEPLIIAALIAEEEKRRLEKKATEEKNFLYLQSSYDRPEGGSRIV
ncbi:MAG: hypothetical protein ACYDHG_13675 [Desulfomonilaceae bacterium]